MLYVRTYFKIKQIIKKSFYIIYSTRLKEHRWIHLDYKPFKCKYCDQTFRQKNHVKHHEAKVHELQKDHECSQCNKTFCFAYELKTHMKNSHKSKSIKDQNDMLVQLQCELCDELFPTLPSLKDHWKEHTQQKIDEDTLENNSSVHNEAQILLEVEGEEQSYIIEYT